MSAGAGRRLLVRLRRLRVMTAKEFLQLLRDPILMGFLVYAFTLDVYLAGSGVSLQLKHAGLAVRDEDQSAASRELIGRFQAPYFHLDGSLAHPDEGMRLLDRGTSMLVLDVPPRFEASLLTGEPTAVQLRVDATNSLLGQLGGSYATQIVAAFGQEAAARRLGSPGTARDGPTIVDEHRVWFNQNESDAWSFAISELLMMVTLFAIMLPAAAMAREKERGTVEQLLVSPLTPFDIMFPKVIAMTVVIVASTLLSVGLVLHLGFAVPLRGSLALFVAITTLYAFTNAGLGMFTATLAQNLAQAGLLSILVLAPTLFLSGAWTPPESMPGWLETGMLLSPLHYYLDATNGIFLKGAGAAILWREILGISVLGAVLFGFGLWRFRRQFG